MTKLDSVVDVILKVLLQSNAGGMLDSSLTVKKNNL